MVIFKEEISSWFMNLQNQICDGLEKLDSKSKFREDIWEREGGGGGKTRILQNGRLFEKGGVNYSAVYGSAPDFLVKQLNAESGAQFYATGISIVIHPNNPHVPIIHMNVRYFEMSGGVHWFGGGIDLTPHYVNQKDSHFFHSQLKETCDKHHIAFYPEFKEWADNYFYIKHRKETRGIGGIFFDQLRDDKNFSMDDRWSFVKNVGLTFLPTYTELVKRNEDRTFSETEKKWQMLRRGRYVEFNLVYDRGTSFGLKTDGRTESILMSLPSTASWEYDYQPTSGSQEEYTMSVLKKNMNWLK